MRLRFGKPKPPTDRQILQKIYDRYYGEFVAWTPTNQVRSAKMYVPIDIQRLSREFGIDADILFGRLYYVLDHRHGYKREDGSTVPFFTRQAGEDINAVHFPMLASVLAEMREEADRFRLATLISGVSAIIAISAVAVSILLRAPS